MTRVQALAAEAGDGMISLWRHIYGEQVGVVGLFSGTRPGPGSKRLESTRQAYFAWPADEERARAWIEREAAAHRETYHCGHLLTDRRRTKENAAPLRRSTWTATAHRSGPVCPLPRPLSSPPPDASSSTGGYPAPWRPRSGSD